MSWAIFIDRPMPEEPLEEVWGNPSHYPTMRDVIHESVHFWHSISTQQGIRLAFDCLKSLNALRFASRKGTDLTKIGADWTFDGYRPFTVLREFYETGSRRTGLDGKIVEPGPHLSPFQIFEGLARYWDQTICAGLTTDKTISSLIDQESPTYSAAYRYTHDTIGPVAFILFPIFGYCALCTEDPIDSLAVTLLNYKRDGFPVPPGDFQLAWNHALESASQWPGLYPRPYAPMTTYKTEHKRYVRWKTKYAGVVPEDFFMTGHPILEDYIQTMMGLARAKWPDLTDHKREEQILVEFLLPGNPIYRNTLVGAFQPPLIRFSDGRTWVRPTERHEKRPEHFERSMQDFSALMGAAHGLIRRAAGTRIDNRCPRETCPIHHHGLCSFVSAYPDTHETCRYKKLFAHEFGVT